jgi:transcriptional repressor NrdR
MHCPKCHKPDAKVIDSRILQEGNIVRRRRKCETCMKRFTTYEKLEIQMPAIVKSDGRREAYRRDKILKGFTKACHKRNISIEQIEQVVDSTEKYIVEKYEREIGARQVGDILMRKIYKLDPVAYVRFASFYWDFSNIEDFVKSLQKDINFSISTKKDKGLDSEEYQ